MGASPAAVEIKPLSLDEAHDQANLILDIKEQALKPQEKKLVKNLGKQLPPEFKERKIKLDNSYFYELAEKESDQIKEKLPDLHEARMAFVGSSSRLAETLAPRFVEINKTGYIPPGEQAVLAKDVLEKAKTENPDSEANPWTKAEQSAKEIILRVADQIDPLEEENNISVIVDIAEAIRHEAEYNKTIYQGDLSPQQIGALTEGVLAVKNTEYWIRKVPKNIHTDMKAKVIIKDDDQMEISKG